MYMVVGLTSDIEANIGFFGTRTATADVLLYYLWEAIDYVETTCGLKVSSVHIAVFWILVIGK
jgi:hypothetical protein